MSPPANSYENAPQDQLYHYGLSDNRYTVSQNNASPDDEYPINSIIPRPLPAPPVSTLLDRLQKLEQLRPIPWRPGQELPPDKSTHSSRVQQRGATLLSTRGVVSNPPCQSCASGNGRFSLCVTADNWFRGACASCLFTSKGNKCSLRRERSGSPEDGSKKRKRKYVSEKQWEHTDTRDGQPLQSPPSAVSSDLDTMLQAQIAREENEHANIEMQGHDYKGAHGRRTVENDQVDNGAYGYVYMSPHDSRETEASVPEAFRPPTQVQRHAANVSSPRSAPTQMSYPTSSTKPIDTVSKSKQRQIFSMISGIQGGIDNLQKQLDSFRTLIGMDADDD